MKNTAQEVAERIKEMQDRKAQDLATVREKQTEAQTQKEAAELAIRTATDKMDLNAYEEAKQAQKKAQAAIDMYNGKYEQVKAQEYITEAESDSVIASLLDYEGQLEEEFKGSVAELLKQLTTVYEAYMAKVEEAEGVLASWTMSIHANYRSATGTYADGTNRSSHPVPVHTMPYKGGETAARLGNYLEKEKLL